MVGTPAAELDPEVVALCEEMRTTEAAYALDLKVTRDLFLAPLRKMQLLEPQDLKAVFANLEELLALSQQLLQLLRKEGDTVSVLADAFHTVAPFFRIYSAYCANYSTAMAAVRELGTKPNGFAEFVASQQQRKETKGLPLAAFLIKPGAAAARSHAQRPPRRSPPAAPTARPPSLDRLRACRGPALADGVARARPRRGLSPASDQVPPLLRRPAQEGAAGPRGEGQAGEGGRAGEGRGAGGRLGAGGGRAAAAAEAARAGVHGAPRSPPKGEHGEREREGWGGEGRGGGAWSLLSWAP